MNRLLKLNAVEEDDVSVAEEVVDKSMAGRHDENGIADIMTELDVVTKFGAMMKMFSPSEHVKPQEFVDPFEEQERIEREEEERRVAQEALFQHLLEEAMADMEENLLEEAIAAAYAKGYSELPQLLALGYHRLPPPPVQMKTQRKSHKQAYGYQKIVKDDSFSPSNSLVSFDKNVPDPSISFSKSLSLPLPLPRVNQADLQCRQDSELNYEVTYQIKTGKRFTNKQKDEDYTLAFSNITDLPNPKPPRKRTSLQGTYELNCGPSTSNDLVLFEGGSSSSGGSGAMLAIANNNEQSTDDTYTASSVMALEKIEEKKREQEKELSLSRLSSVYIEKQQSERRLKEPDWMLMQHRLRLNESVHTEKFVTFEIVSMAKTIALRDTEFIMNKPIIRFGTLDACDYTVKCSNNVGGDIRKERALSKIHCMVYVPLVPPMSKPGHDRAKTNTGGGKNKKYQKSYDSDSDSDSDEEAERQSHEKRASQVTIVDNHSCWGTYVVTQHGVKKVPTTIQAGIPLEHGDLICMGITRNGPTVMTAIEANRALLVFRVRTDYCVTIGKVPEFNVGEMIMNEQEKSEKVERVAYR